jgi:predicted MFS family arabinose efflux permease
MTAGATLGSAAIQCNQPLLPTIATSLGVSASDVAPLPSLTQWGYALGLAMLVPLFDVVARRRLVVVLQVLSSVALLGIAVAPSSQALLVIAPVAGFVACSSQVLTPYAGAVSQPEQRARAVATVLGGVLAGVLLGRVIGGFLGAVVSWRAVYLALAVATLVSAVVLGRRLPPSRNPEHETYSSVMRSMGHLVATLQPLRRHALLGLLIFGSFMAFWSTYAFVLSDEFGIGPSGAGLVALVGLGGALAAPRAGRLVDQGGFQRSAVLGGVLAVGGWALAATGVRSVVTLTVGALLLDLGTGLAHGANLSALQRSYPAVGGRINAVYMVMYFVGGATGAAIAPWIYLRFGWPSVAVFAGAGAAVGVALTVLWRSSLRDLQPAPVS